MTAELVEHTRATEAQVEKALQLRAALGNSVAAAKQLGMSERTLQHWVKHTHRDRYLTIRETVAPKIHDTIAAETEDLVLQMADVRRQALNKLEQGIQDLAPKDAAGAVKNLAIAEANGIDKALLLRGKATHITEHRSPQELYKELEHLGFRIEPTHVDNLEPSTSSPT